MAGLAAVNMALHGFWHEHANVLITKPLQCLAILLIALLIRALAHRAVNRLVKSSISGSVPKVLSPLAERAREAAFLDAGRLSERRRQRAETIGSVLRSAISFVLLITGFLLILAVYDINLAPFLAGTSLVGVAVGFGAQNLVKDFLSGIFLMLEDQYGVGDVIDVGQATGTVESVGLRTTRLRDIEGIVWYVRNGEIIRVGNSSQQYAQVVLDVPLARTDDLVTAQAAIRSAAAAVYADAEWQRHFLTEPEVLGVESLRADGLTVRLVARVRPLEQWRVARQLRGRIQAELAGSASGS
jgi:small conductance mechanosensitive channel